MFTKDVSLTVTTGGTSQQLVLAAATSNAGMTPMTEDGYVVVTVDSLTFVRKGTGVPVAVNTGVDQVLLANNAYRIGPLLKGELLAFISTAGGNAYITPQG